mmetsp:Transcript_15602/g.25537  ORF Transcript_15602/g.25537 Transcript_15602/m.25537 type:complete len:337 (+) Transcript_15602:63-1073(+)|eukprot:CAMPEP_0203746858 /NCGR_PEP_ID=MMETSP0098-20131031/2179_1 /ASSEMBLY_ACC=CAM_ASM_000208 /TAXON_ID=96639 /ORGANISM=" , Strain NY0313808BC1" /LENGTH=336 /DNA_ID=CAMNT_0050635111 /DNA_START=1781 /DNA_END=2788 /DNA_ORIENTATION=+
MGGLIIKVLVSIFIVGAKETNGSRANLTVMAYNIMQLPFKWVPFAGSWDQTERLHHLGMALGTLPEQPDVTVFQEVLDPDAYPVVASLNPYNTPVVGKDCDAKGPWESTSGKCKTKFWVIRGGVMIGSKHPITEQHQLVFTHFAGDSWDAWSNKGAAHAKIQIGDYFYHVIGTHLQADEDNVDYHHIRMQQLAELKSWVDSLGIPTSEPVILAGDLNVKFSRSERVEEMLNTTSSSMSFDGKTFSYPEKNWMSRASRYYYKDNMCGNDTLDYVMHRKDHLKPVTPPALKAIALKSPTDWYWSYLKGKWPLCSGEKWHDGRTRDTSDHYPVQATYTY